MDFLRKLIVTGALNHEFHHDILLNELGLTPRCWPLSLPPSPLSLLGLVMVCRLQRRAGAEDGDDRLAVSIWKGYVHVYTCIIQLYLMMDVVDVFFYMCVRFLHVIMYFVDFFCFLCVCVDFYGLWKRTSALKKK